MTTQSDLALQAGITRLKTAAATLPVSDRLFELIRARYEREQGPGKLNASNYTIEPFHTHASAEGVDLPLKSYIVDGRRFTASAIPDANFGGALCYRGFYCGIFSGFPLDDGSTFLVVQLQGARASSPQPQTSAASGAVPLSAPPRSYCKPRSNTRRCLASPVLLSCQGEKTSGRSITSGALESATRRLPLIEQRRSMTEVRGGYALR